jgi:hypothetical protein
MKQQLIEYEEARLKCLQEILESQFEETKTLQSQKVKVHKTDKKLKETETRLAQQKKYMKLINS